MSPDAATATGHEVLLYPDPRLLEPSDPVQEFDHSVANTARALLDTLYGSTGIALSAPQLDDRRQILVMDLSEERNAPQIYVNPEILARKRPGLVEESCLSLPGITGNVLRHTRVRVRAQDEHGEFFERDLEDMYAVALQHEMDHFDGTLFIDRLSWLKRLRLRMAGVI